MKIIKSILLSAFLLTGFFGCSTLKIEAQVNAKKQHIITTETAEDLKDFFKYSPDRIPFVSAHRGGARKDFPENCIATFENTLSHTHALLEIDPHYTKDGHIVLMHDPTVDRTTNGTGKVKGLTLEEIKQLRLKDTEGNLTDYQVPTLDEALQWARGKTILVIDAKDVPIEERVKKIIENDAEGNAIVIAYSMPDILKAYALHSGVVMEVMMGKMDKVSAIDNSKVPWENCVGFVSHNLPQDPAIFEAVHSRGAMCIQGTSRNYDIEFIEGKISQEELYQGYREIVKNGADVIEADLGVEAGEALKTELNDKSSKSKYFKIYER